MVDRERVLVKLDQLDQYLRELRTVAPHNLEEYRRIQTKRSCERLLQVSIECVIDVCSLLVAVLRLGLPAEEDDLFEKLRQADVVSDEMRETLKRMKGLRNILVHEYARVDDGIVFEAVRTKLADFDEFKRQALSALSQP